MGLKTLALFPSVHTLLQAARAAANRPSLPHSFPLFKLPDDHPNNSHIVVLFVMSSSDEVNVL